MSRPRLALDTETTGLYPWGKNPDRLFSIQVGDVNDEYYFDFNDGGLPREVLTILAVNLIEVYKSCWYFINAIFDLSILAADDIYLNPDAYTIDCASLARVEFSNHQGKRTGDGESLLSMDYLAQYYLGQRKDDAVEKYIKEHGAYKLDRYGDKAPDYTSVPLDLMFPYGCKDARLTYDIGAKIIEKLRIKAAVTECDRLDPKISIMSVVENEVKLTPCLFKIKQNGMKIDRKYCEEAVVYYEKVADSCMKNARTLLCAGEETNLNSGDQLAKLLMGQGIELPYTLKTQKDLNSGKSPKKLRYKTDETTLAAFNHKGIRNLVEAKKALKKNNTYFKKFLKLADENDILHCNLHQETCITGRMSSSNPNLQNLHNVDKDKNSVYPVRGAFIPKLNGYLMFDYSKQEMVTMVDQAGEMPVIEKLKRGEDFYMATNQAILDACGRDIGRYASKQIALGISYGQGIAALAKKLGVSYNEARTLYEAFMHGLPKVADMNRRLKNIAKYTGQIQLPSGRINHIDRGFEYKALNSFAQGTAADQMKKSVVVVDDYLSDKQSHIALIVHDELVIDYAEDELEDLVRDIPPLMSSTYKHKHIPIGVDIEISNTGRKSWIEKTKYVRSRGNENSPKISVGTTKNIGSEAGTLEDIRPIHIGTS